MYPGGPLLGRLLCVCYKKYGDKLLRRFITLIISMLALAGCLGGGKTLEVVSPDKHLAVQLHLDERGELFYQVRRDGNAIITPSKLGFSFKGHPPLDKFELVDAKLSSYDNTWTAVWGERKRIINNYNQLFVEFKEKRGDRQLNVRFRLYDDGLGFRYEFPQQSAFKSFVIMNEMTQFNLAEDSTAWWIPADYDSYEKLYKTSKVSELRQVQTPLTMKTPAGQYVSIHEAALTDYASMTLSHQGEYNLEAELVPWQDGTKVKAATPFQTPWRTLQITDSASGLLQSDLLLNLNEPSRIDDTSWIEPMNFIGVWWGVHIGVHTWQEGPRHGATTERAKQYIDFAAANNIGGVLFEGWNKGWDNWGTREAYLVPTDDFNLQEVAAYARAKNVSIVGHNETGGNVEAYEQHVEEVFSLYQKLGIRVVKTGYVAEQGFSNGEHHQGQWGVNHYRRIVKLAAKYHIMLNVHEPVKDTGIRRTWPNMMTREGARGGEWNAWSAGNNANHTQILPFTRLLAGPMDYTVGIFDIDYSRFSGQRYDWSNKPQTGQFRVHTTLSHQLANLVTLYSPLQMMADMIENYIDHPAFKFIRDFDPDIDETQVLDGEIGEYVAIARRSGDVWMLGATTGTSARRLSLPLDFLLPEKQYQAEIYQDTAQTDCAAGAENYEIVTRTVTASEVLNLQLVECGGAAVRFTAL
mgnify:CR=1 FL=1